MYCIRSTYIEDKFDIRRTKRHREGTRIQKQPTNIYLKMSIKYALYETPAPSGRKNNKTNQHARVIPQGTKDTEFLCKVVSEHTSFSSTDVKKLLEVLTHWMGHYLKEGNSLELSGLGHFTPTLRSKEYVGSQGKKQLDIQIDTISYRCSPWLKKEVQKATLEEVVRDTNPKLEASERKSNILNYARKHFSISCTACMQTNGCTRYTALLDLKELVAEGELIATGNGRQRIYILPYPDQQ